LPHVDRPDVSWRQRTHSEIVVGSWSTKVKKFDLRIQPFYHRRWKLFLSGLKFKCSFKLVGHYLQNVRDQQKPNWIVV
jgi:hypothetical protein